MPRFLTPTRVTSRPSHNPTHTNSIADLRTALAATTAIPPADQILMARGVALEDGRGGGALGAHGLPPPPGEAGARLEDAVFLYARPLLRPGAPPPEAPALTPAGQAVPGLEEVAAAAAAAQPHALDASPSPAARALPALERACAAHLGVAAALWDAGAAARADIDRLARTAAVQAAAADAARATVERHYASTAAGFRAFASSLVGTTGPASPSPSSPLPSPGLLADPVEALRADVDALASVRLHPAATRVAAAREEGGGGGGGGGGGPFPSTLADLLPTPALQAWASRLAAARAALDARTAGIQANLAALAADVEALLMCGPPVDVASLAPAAASAAAWSEEQGRAVAALSSDLAAARRAIDAALAADAAGGRAALYASTEAAAGRLAVAVERQAGALLPAAHRAGLALAGSAVRAAATQHALATDAAGQLRRVAAHQSALHALRADLGVLARAAEKQAAAGAALARVRRLPAAYRACLAERVRRDAWAEATAGRAAAACEALAASAAREGGRRAGFAGRAGALIPPHVLASLGLTPLPPPAARLVVPAEPDPAGPGAPPAPRVTLEDVRAAVPPPGMGGGAGEADCEAGEDAPAALFPEVWVARAAAPPPPPPAPAPSVNPLALENARLRAEVAALRAADAAAVAAAAAVVAAAPPTPARRPTPPASPKPPPSPSRGSPGSSSGGGDAGTATTTLAAAAAAFTAALAARDDLIVELQQQAALVAGRVAGGPAGPEAAAAAARQGGADGEAAVRVRLEVVDAGDDKEVATA